jgi:2-iminobutanoate/2-iminopropanoate deaminase
MRKNIMLPDHPAGLPFSDAVLIDNTLYISGRIGIDPQTGRAHEDIDRELAILFDGFERVLAAASMTMSDVVSVTVFCPDLSLFARFNAAYRGRFQSEFPARAFIGSGPLLLGGRFEIVGVAVKA